MKPKRNNDGSSLDLSVLKSRLVEPDFLLPVQTTSDHGVCMSERKLLYELLMCTLHDLSSPDAPIRDSARHWILEGNHGAFTCREVCACMDIDYEALVDTVRAGLRLTRRRRVNGYVRQFPSRAARRTRDKRKDGEPIFNTERKPRNKSGLPVLPGGQDVLYWER